MTRSGRLWKEAVRLMPGGVSSPVRAFRAVGGDPRLLVRGRGSRVTDADGKAYVDYVGAWGPLILGHAHPRVAAAAARAVKAGWGFGATHPAELALARLVRDAFPAVERVRFVSSGTEAVMSTARLARAATGRELLLKFEGCYHGHSDAFLSRAGSGLATFGIPESPGVVRSLAARTITLPYNDASAVERCFRRTGGKIACVIVEPVAGNMGVVPPVPGFLAALRRITRRHGALLVFDEVITGFRIGWGGAQGAFGIRPDLTVLGKILGGGFPAAAYGGPARIMERLAPLGPVYQAGTLSGNPVAMAAGAETLSVLRREKPWERLARRTERLASGIEQAARARRIPLVVQRLGSMWTPFFTRGPVLRYADAARSDRALYARFFRGMLARGVYLPPSALEAAFVSTAHTERDIDRTIASARAVFRAF